MKQSLTSKGQVERIAEAKLCWIIVAMFTIRCSKRSWRYIYTGMFLVIISVFAFAGWQLAVHNYLTEHEAFCLFGIKPLPLRDVPCLITDPVVRSSWKDIVYSWHRFQSNGWLFYWLCSLQSLLVPSTNWAIRWPVLLCCMISLLAVYRLGSLLHSRPCGIYAALLLAGHIEFLGVSAHYRFYALGITLSLLTSLAWVKAWRSDDGHWNVWWTLYTLACWASVCTMALSAMLVCEQLLLYLLLSPHKKRALWRLLIVATIISGVCGWLHWRDDGALNRVFYDDFHLEWWNEDVQALLCHGFYFINMPCGSDWDARQDHWITVCIAVNAALTLLVLLWGAGRELRLWYRGCRVPLGLLPLLWAVVPLIVVVAFSCTVRSIWQPTNLCWTWPLWALATALGLVYCHRYVRWLYLLAFLLIIPHMAPAVYVDGDGNGGALRFLVEHILPDDYAIVYANSIARLIRPQIPVHCVPSPMNSPLAASRYLVDIENLPKGRPIIVDGDKIVSLLGYAHGRPLMRGRRLWVLEKATERLMGEWIICAIEGGYLGSHGHSVRAVSISYGREKLWMIGNFD